MKKLSMLSAGLETAVPGIKRPQT